jgi:hypothetical protein
VHFIVLYCIIKTYIKEIWGDDSERIYLAQNGEEFESVKGSNVYSGYIKWGNFSTIGAVIRFSGMSFIYEGHYN